MKPQHAIHPLLAGLVTAAFLTVALSACQSMGTAPITPDRLITLEPAGPHQGDADTGDLALAYIYQLKEGTVPEIQISGRIRSARSRGDKTSVYLNFVDSNGQVLDRKILFSTGYKQDVYVRRPSTFDTTLPLPPDTTAIAFSSYVEAYSGHN
jgi:hypothetical protein